MKTKIAAASFVILAAAFYLWPKEKAADAVPAAPAVAAQNNVSSSADPGRGIASASAPAASSGGERSLANTPLEEGEKKSIATLMNLLSRPDEVGKSPRALFDALAQAGLKPVAAKDSNDYTGTLWTVRTDNALPGTRYFHAQLFGEGETHMQHVSFEIRPGSDSMNQAAELVRQANPDLGRPEIERDDYILWKKKGGKVISVKRLGAEELRDSRFNAHAPEDTGTIWVTSEDEPSHDLAQF
jgi:hypothetical protein